ncbi:hypothetical protein F5I97DRAFT_1934109 [Phlebopus sp. FC_14]|nr:hypothetical protein F5I97DRAFT_1934109 [Phlebopus sp. FC_14]
MRPRLPASIKPGLVCFPGRDPEAQRVVERLLEKDREKNHCYFNSRGFHNHLSHHLLASYDLGAPAQVLQAIYSAEDCSQRPINLEGEKEDTAGYQVHLDQVKITPDNFGQYLGQERYYGNFLSFFTQQIIEHGVGETLERYIFDAAVNVKGFEMLARFLSGAYHPWIQTGYGAEFGSDAMVAQGLAQTSVHDPFAPELFNFATPGAASDEASSIKGRPLLHILRDVYASEILRPVMPYDPNALLSARREALMKNGRPEEISRLCAYWWNGGSLAEQAAALGHKIEEMFWVCTLLLSGTGKRGRKPRLDFFLMHALNASLFLPSLLKVIPSEGSKVKLVKGFLPITVMFMLLRGRPRIDPGLAMSYTASPRPPKVSVPPVTPSQTTIGDPRDPASYNPWHDILASVIHAPDAHTVKAVRALCYAAQRYGHKQASDIPGCYIDEARTEETVPGIASLDGTVFVRSAGVVMNTLGWVTHGDEAGEWDRSGLGWEDAWKTMD